MMKEQKMSNSAHRIFSSTLVALLVACGGGGQAEPTAVPDTRSTDTSEAEGAVEPVSLQFSTWAPSAGDWIAGVQTCLNAIEEATGGLVTFEHQYSASLVPFGEEPDALQSGLAHVSTLNPGLSPGKLPYTSVVGLPGITSSLEAASRAGMELWRVNEAVADEWNGWNMRPFCSNSLLSFSLMTTKPINSMEDLRGLRVALFGPQVELAEALGMNVVSVPVPDWAGALERGGLDGYGNAHAAVKSLGLAELTPYSLEIEFGAQGTLTGIGTTTWNSLPEDLRSTIEQVLDESHQMMVDVYGGGNEATRQELLAAGFVDIELSEDIAAAREGALESVWSTWVEDLESRGFDAAQTVLEDYQRLVTE
jgi:TRAP-type C4-dicarboxylate transport system substrate-binding protein